MKVLFAGPSLFGLVTPGATFPDTDILCRPPAQQGDIARAVLDGATVLGLVDGRYEDVAAPWHKEILYALDQGLRVFGSASMGALRAAECASFGMIPIGGIARRYLSGEITDDAEVAQIHGPAELGWMPLSEALVNVEASLVAAANARALSPAQAARLEEAAGRMFFKERTLASIVREAGFAGGAGEAIEACLRTHWRDIKREDALALVEAMRSERPLRFAPTRTWRFREPSAWRRFLQDLCDSRADGSPSEDRS